MRMFRKCPCHNEWFVLGDYKFEDTETVHNGMQVRIIVLQMYLRFHVSLQTFDAISRVEKVIS